MAEKHRVRGRKFQVHLLDEELKILNDKAEQAKMSKAEYVRNVILFGAARGGTNFDSEDAKAIMYELNRIGNNINQIAYQANSKCAVDMNDFTELREQFALYLAEFERVVMR